MTACTAEVSITSASTLLLDGIAAAPNAAYSLNDRLSSSYTGPLIRVRRSSDSTEQDIGYGADVLLDRTALSTFCGAGNGFVVTFYDQSGNGRDITQATAANQASVYNAGSVRTSGGNVIALFDGSNDSYARADALGMSGDANLTIAMLYRLDARASQRAVFGLGGTGFSNEFVIGHENAAANTLLATSDETLDKWPATNATSYHYDVVRHTSGQNMSQVSWRQNGAALTASATVTSAVNLTNTSTRLGGHLANVAFAAMSFSTLIVWNSVISGGDLTALEASLEAKRTA